MRHPLCDNDCGEIGAAVRKVAADTNRLLDIGPGIRPYPFAGPNLRVEPHEQYADWLEHRSYLVLRSTALNAMPLIGKSFGTIFMLDVIEHMEKDEGMKVIEMARERAKVVIFTPLGFMPQDGPDPWGMGGEYWQKHKSGWTPADFPGWDVTVNEIFHGECGAFLAVSPEAL